MPALDVLLPELRDLAQRIAADAGRFLRDGLNRPRESVDTKSSGTDMVSEMDRGAERLIVDAIAAARPHDGLLGEEGAERAGTSGFRWVIDPLDGTTNYLYRHPFWGVSLGIELEGEPVVGVVEAPMIGETYAATKGGGATLNGRPLRVGTCTDIGFALTGTGFGYAPERRAVQGATVARLLPVVRDLRRGGSAALDLCFVAAGRLDAYYEFGLNPWDACAGTVIVREAGGVVSSLHGDAPTNEMTLAGNATLHAALRDLLRAG